VVSRAGGSRRAEERLRKEAATWFARMRAPDAAASRPAFEAWLKADPERQIVYARLLQRWGEAGILALSDQQPARTPSRGRPSIWRPIGWSVAAIACAVALIVILPATSLWPQGWPTLGIGDQRLTTAVGEIRTVRLADGSSVTLDTDTAVTTAFSPSKRRLSLLHGRARFDVAHDPSRPFIVWADGATVTARGTLFDVAVSPGHAAVVTLMRGVVDVQPAAPPIWRSPAPKAPIRLAPGQRLAFEKSFAAPHLQAALAVESAWPNGRLVFHGEALSDALAQANRYSRQRITLAEASLGQLQVSGVFPIDQQPELAASLGATFSLRVDQAANGDLVLTRSPTTTSNGPS